MVTPPWCRPAMACSRCSDSWACTPRSPSFSCSSSIVRFTKALKVRSFAFQSIFPSTGRRQQPWRTDMASLWFLIVALMVVAYVVLDGFDLGAGAIHLIVAKTDDERASVIRAIGPVWDGNEVWLLAAGGVLYFAFPLLYASSFQGFYLPLIIVLWLLMLRGIGIEFRHQSHSPVWRKFFDTIFSGASAVLAVFFGAALGNVIRGVPLGADGYFFEALWTNWHVVPNPGILDWYTVIAGVVALVALTLHGSL